MATLATELVKFSELGDTITFTATGHTAAKPRYCVQKRKLPVGNQTMIEDRILAVYHTVDAGGDPLPQNIVFEISLRRPKDAASADVAAAQALIQAITVADEFADVISDSARLPYVLQAT